VRSLLHMIRARCAISDGALAWLRETRPDIYESMTLNLAGRLVPSPDERKRNAEYLSAVVVALVVKGSARRDRAEARRSDAPPRRIVHAVRATHRPDSVHCLEGTRPEQVSGSVRA
jgi:hypothetical protein